MLSDRALRLDSEHAHFSRSGHHSRSDGLRADVGMTAQLVNAARSTI